MQGLPVERGWLDHLNPVAFRIPVPGVGTLPIRWYGLSYLLGFVVGYYLLRRLARRGRLPLTEAQVGDFIGLAVLGVMIGGRLGYAAFYEPRLFTTFSSRVPFWELLAIWHGGMASHGGMIGLAVTCLWFAHRERISVLPLFDGLALTAPPGLFFGRIANFINGELYGRPAPVWLPWAVRFPQELPSQRIGPGLTPRHPSQLYEALLEGVMLFVALNLLARHERRPGVIAACFLIGYAIARIVVEFFREPDAQIGLQWLGLSRGQWISGGMLTLGVVLYRLWARGPMAPPAGPTDAAAPDGSLL